MVAGSRCSGRASTKRDHHDGEHDERLLEQQPVLDRRRSAFIAITRASRSGVVFRSRPQTQWIMIACTTITTMMTGARWMTKSLKREPDLRADQDVGRIADQRRGAADVGGEDLGEQERIGRHFELA